MNRDNIGYLPNEDLLYTRWIHFKTQKVYVITGFVWIGDSDQWGVLHVNKAGVQYVRTVSNFFGLNPEGKYRFIEDAPMASSLV